MLEHACKWDSCREKFNSVASLWEHVERHIDNAEPRMIHFVNDDDTLDTPQAKIATSSVPTTLAEKTRGPFQSTSLHNASAPTNVDNHSAQITSIQQSTIQFSHQTLGNSYLVNQAGQVAFNPLGLQQIIRPGPQGVTQGVQPVNFVQPVQQPYIITATPQIMMRPTPIYGLQHYQPTINLQGVNAPQLTSIQPQPSGTRPIAIGNTSNSIPTTDDNASRVGGPNRISAPQSLQITSRNPPAVQRDPQ
ncbi:20141_t:CDS:2 [Dentiscutata erythropus]|uniref:20141_t:CDS:1 n=1 Tax=Dentiscutata erythropus TaxID=1348616 RepID=A0A9N9HJ27_9GLOM|nr:20141_t:CDS:2 [Dentiscutata erythropus]